MLVDFRISDFSAMNEVRLTWVENASAYKNHPPLLRKCGLSLQIWRNDEWRDENGPDPSLSCLELIFCIKKRIQC